MFAFVIWDARERVLFVARDRLGIKPLYYAERRNGLVIASDSRAILALDGPRSISQEALLAYCVLGYVPTPMSIWNGISKLPSGSTLEWTGRGPSTVRRYWDPPRATDPTDKNVASLDGLLETVVGDHLLSDVPVGMFLSSGIDSSLIASYAAVRQPNFRAITVAFPGAPERNEAPIACRTAQVLGIDAREVPIDASNVTGHFDNAVAAFDEPIAYSAIVTQLAISQAAQPHFKVVLSGDGGDEVFGGYRWYEGQDREFGKRRGIADLLLERLARAARGGERHQRLDRILERRFKNRSWLHSHLAGVFPALRPDELDGILRDGDGRHAEELAVETLRQYDAPQLPLRRRLQRIDLMTFCQEAVLAKVDRAGMAYSIEVRPPLLDHRVVEWGLYCPLAYWSDRNPKGALRALLERRGLTHLLSVPKRGFSLRGAAPYGKGAILKALNRGSREPDGFLRVGWHSSVSNQSRSFGLKLQALFIFERWRSAVTSRTRPDPSTPIVAPHI
jgi:asparagine synthase (glutamine-hydrolysing)